MNEKKVIKIIMLESILAYAACGIPMPIMTVFWNQIGMNQTLIGLSQALCTMMMIFFDIPMGYIADKFNRKIMNIIGDIGMCVTFIIYMFANNFFFVILAETLCGIFAAITNGVDNSFLKFYSDKIDKTGKLFEKNNSRLAIFQSIGFVLAISLGMIVSKYSVKLCVGLVAIPFLIAALISIFIKDIGEKITNKAINQNEIKKDFRMIFKNKNTKWYMLGYTILDNIAHPIIWVLTPLLLSVGIPVYIVGIAWIFNYIGPIFGGIIAKKLQNKKLVYKFLIPYIFMLCGMIPILINTNIVTVWFFILTGLASGFGRVLLLPLIQNSIEDKYQTTILSINNTLTRLIYFPIVFIINFFGNNNPKNSLLADLVIFLPIVMIILYKYNKIYKNERLV